jgi:UDP-glucose 4-epimerase
VREVIEAAREVTGHPIPAKITPRRAGDAAVMVASSQKAKDLLGWKPRYPLIRDIVKTAWDWHQTHPHGYSKS